MEIKSAIAINLAPLPKGDKFKYEVGGKIPVLNNMEVSRIDLNRQTGATEVFLRSKLDGTSYPWKVFYPGYPAMEVTLSIPKKHISGNEAD